MIDLHTHILPGFDDGVRSIEEARELARLASAEGVTAIAATPHVRDDYPTTPEKMERGVERLRADFVREGIELEILYGGEVAFERVWQLPEPALARFTYCQTGRYLLLEPPYQAWPEVLEQTIDALLKQGVTPLIAHPERNPEIQAHPEHLRPLVEAGALTQVTAASIEGRLGDGARAAASRLLELDLVHVLATDAHGPHIRQGGLSPAVAALGDPDLARYLTSDVPRAIAAGKPIPGRGRTDSSTEGSAVANAAAGATCAAQRENPGVRPSWPERR